MIITKANTKHNNLASYKSYYYWHSQKYLNLTLNRYQINRTITKKEKKKKNKKKIPRYILLNKIDTPFTDILTKGNQMGVS